MIIGWVWNGQIFDLQRGWYSVKAPIGWLRPWQERKLSSAVDHCVRLLLAQLTACLQTPSKSFSTIFMLALQSLPSIWGTYSLGWWSQHKLCTWLSWHSLNAVSSHRSELCLQCSFSARGTNLRDSVYASTNPSVIMNQNYYHHDCLWSCREQNFCSSSDGAFCWLLLSGGTMSDRLDQTGMFSQSMLWVVCRCS